MLDDIFGSLKAAPPPSRPGPGKRRPQPRSLSRPGPCAKYVETGPNRVDLKEEAANADAEEVARLLRVVGELTRTCEQQAQELAGLRSRVHELESAPASAPTGKACCPSVVSKVHEPDSPVSEAMAFRATIRVCAEQCTQTEVDAGAAHIDAQSQREELDAVHREAGEKTRELRKAQESVRLLHRELTEQRLIAEQYRAQVDILEEQLLQAAPRRLRGQPSSNDLSSAASSHQQSGSLGVTSGVARGSRTLSGEQRQSWSTKNPSDAAVRQASSAMPRPRSATRTASRSRPWQPSTRSRGAASSSEDECGDDV